MKHNLSVTFCITIMRFYSVAWFDMLFTDTQQMTKIVLRKTITTAVVIMKNQLQNDQNQSLRAMRVEVDRNCLITFVMFNFHQKTVTTGKPSFHSLINRIK